MRKKLSLVFGAAFLALAVAGCEGPAGPPGADGADGQDGIDGVDGQDANENCIQCHANDTEIFARQVQYQNSTHFLGGNFERGSSTYSLATLCAGCHTHEGFIEVLSTGDANRAVAAGFENPSPPNCRTCHQIHTTYTSADWALSTVAAVDLITGEGQVDFGDGNLCVNCHQGRDFDKPTIDGADVVTELRYGYHHGPQAQVLGGIGGFALTGSQTITTGPNTHGETANDGCPTCHMQDPWGAQAGGHTWKMEYEYHGSTEHLIAVCEGCHSTYSVDDFDHSGVQTTVETRLDSLWTLLVAAGIGVDGDRPHAVADTFAANLAAAFANFQMFEEDRSKGIHNPGYALKMLQNSIEVAETYVP